MISKLSHYVNDTSGVLSATRKHELNELFAAIDNESSIQVVTVIFPHREGRELRDIALEVFNENGIGQKGKNNGLLLIIASDEKKIRIMTGKGLEWIYSDAWCRKVIEQRLRPLLNEGKYEDVVQAWHEEIYKKQSSKKQSSKKQNYPINGLRGIIAMFTGTIGTTFLGIFLFSTVSHKYIMIGWFSLLLLLFIFSKITHKRWNSYLVSIFLVSILFFVTLTSVNKRVDYCTKNQTECSYRYSSSSSNSSYNSSSSNSSSSRSSSSSSRSSSNFGGGGGSSNAGGYGD